MESSSSSSSSSSPEEENRLKALFTSCDSNNDGRLDKMDLVIMCKKLNMVELAEEIICALGTDVKGSTISFPEFLRCRSHILKGAEASQPEAEYLHYHSQSQYDQVRGSSSDLSQIYSSVDYDSGMQEPHEEPLNLDSILHQYYPDLYNQWTSSQVDNNNALFQQLLQCANHIHLARLNRLYAELKIALKRINSSNISIDLCQKEINRIQKDRNKLKLELQNQSSRYEDRLTELHSVIAELQKKIDKKDRNTIKEEDEDSINVEDYEKIDVCRFTSWNKEIRRSSTASLLENTCSMDQSMTMDPIQSVRSTIECQTEITVKSDFLVANIQKNDALNEKIQEVAEKQLKSFHDNNMYLQEKLSGYENVVSHLRVQLDNAVEEREMLRKQLKELQDSAESGNTHNTDHPPYSSSCSMSKVSLDSKSTNSSSSSSARPIMGVRHQYKQIHLKSQTPDPEWVSRAVSVFQRSIHSSSNSNVQSMISSCLNEDSNFIQTTGLIFLQVLADNVPYTSMTEPCRRIYLEWQRLVAISDRESSDQLLLQRTLAESKSIADQLQCSLVQLESDCGVLTKCSMLADQIIELADLVIQLQETDPLESNIDINNQSEGLEPSYYQNSSFVTTSRHHNRNNSEVNLLRHGYREQLESSAKHFLCRLECNGSMGRQTPDSGAGVSSTLSSGGRSADIEGVIRQASGCGNWTKIEEMKLRRLLDQLMGELSKTKLLIVGTNLGHSFYGQSVSNQCSLKRKQDDNACSFHVEPSLSRNHQQFIENAILLQEVCTLKEERATLKTNIYLLEKEITSLQIGLESRISTEKFLKMQLGQMMQHRADNNSVPWSEESRLLKVQVNDLLRVIEELREHSHLQQHQNEEFVNDLKRANAALISAFDKAKKKYQCKILRLEQQLSNMLHPLLGSDETAL